MITPATLKSYTVKDLAELAKKSGLAGWQSMRKEQLVKALVRAQKTKKPASEAKSKTNSKPAAARSRGASSARSASSANSAPARRNGSSKSVSAAKPTAAKAGKSTPSAPPSKPSRVAKRIHRMNEVRERQRDLAGDRTDDTGIRDRLVLMVRDPYWLHACWEVTRQSVERARAAMAEHWHSAQPTLRVMAVETGATTSTAECALRDIPVHGGVKNWYIDVKDPPKSYRVDLGYLAANGKFFVISRSNIVSTPKPGSSDAIDENWSDIAENYEKIYAQSGGYTDDGNKGELQELFEERLRRPMGAPLVTRYGMGAERMLGRTREFQFEVEAEMIVFGTTHPDAHVQLGGEPVKIREDGSFTVRMSMPDRRQVIPIVASSNDGVEQRTIVLAIERNTKVMEPMIRDAND